MTPDWPARERDKESEQPTKLDLPCQSVSPISEPNLEEVVLRPPQLYVRTLFFPSFVHVRCLG